MLDHFAMAVNYGLDKLRFPAPLRVGDRVRMRVALEAVDEIPGGAALSVTLTFEPESACSPSVSPKPSPASTRSGFER
jgi:acyl dehydratase